MENSKNFYDFNDVMGIVGCSKTQSYKVIGDCNKELESKGYMTFKGIVPSIYFESRIGFDVTDRLNGIKFDKNFMDYDDVKEIFGCSKTMTYKVIGSLNKELENEGYMTFRGKVSTNYFMKRIGVGVVWTKEDKVKENNSVVEEKNSVEKAA